MIARILVLAVLFAGAAAAQSPKSGPPPIRVKASVNRTAVWVGDPVELVVDFALGPQVDVIAEDLAKEKLKLEDLQVVSTSSERLAGIDGGVTHRFRYVLSSYEPAASTLRVAGWPVRYYVRRAGERPEDVRPEGEVQVPAVTIAQRSTLPDDLTGVDLRASGGPADPPRFLNRVGAVGVALVLLAAAPLAVWIIVAVGQWRSRARRRPAVTRAQVRSALEDLRGANADTEAGRREAYERLERALRQHFAAARGIPAHALVSREITQRLHSAGSPDADTAGELLAECERARYGPPDRLPTKERFAEALEATERILAGARS